MVEEKPGNSLTQREQEVLQLVALGLTNAQIGTELKIAERTVRQHMENIMLKMQVANRTETPSALTIDEQLNVYKCPGYLYEKPVGRINDNGTLIITDNFWYEAITLESDCVSDCIYGPICYGGCHFQAGSLEKNLCDRKTHDILIKSRIKLYADSLVKQKNGLKL